MYKSIKYAKELLDNDQIVAIPTETVYGLAGNVYSEKAIKRIFRLKKRPFYNPLIVHIPNQDLLDSVAKNIPEKAYKLAHEFWPGPLTLLLDKQNTIPDIVTAGLPTVAVRVPNHPLTLSLLEDLDYPLAAPSANPFKAISPTSAKHVEHYFGGKLKCIIDGGSCENGVESTIIGFNSNQQPVLYRHGSISIEQIEGIVGKVLINTSSNSNPTAPGMLSKHYAPSTKIIVSNNISETIQALKDIKIGLIMFKDSDFNHRVNSCEILSLSGDFKEATKNFYKALHRLDELDLDIIIAEEMPMYDLGLTLNDRLNRAIK
jgi:L-threonylcarbamoyladenylate synthase